VAIVVETMGAIRKGYNSLMTWEAVWSHKIKAVVILERVAVGKAATAQPYIGRRVDHVCDRVRG
jgi:hypothetical protein